MADKPSYSIDSSALIHAWRRVYRPKSFGVVWEKIHFMALEGRLAASIEVFNELEKKDDELFAWCKERKGELFREIDEEAQAHVVDLMAKYPRLVDTVKGRNTADPFVIALAKTGKPPMVICSEEKPGKIKIPDVCDGEGLKYCDLADMIEAEGWDFK